MTYYYRVNPYTDWEKLDHREDIFKVMERTPQYVYELKIDD